MQCSGRPHPILEPQWSSGMILALGYLNCKRSPIRSRVEAFFIFAFPLSVPFLLDFRPIALSTFGRACFFCLCPCIGIFHFVPTYLNFRSLTEIGSGS